MAQLPHQCRLCVDLYNHGTAASSTPVMRGSLQPWCRPPHQRRPCATYNHGNDRLINIDHAEYIRILTKVHRPIVSTISATHNLILIKLAHETRELRHKHAENLLQLKVNMHRLLDSAPKSLQDRGRSQNDERHTDRA